MIIWCACLAGGYPTAAMVFSSNWAGRFALFFLPLPLCPHRPTIIPFTAAGSVAQYRVDRKCGYLAVQARRSSASISYVQKPQPDHAPALEQLFPRLTHSKKIDSYVAMVALYATWYNFAWTNSAVRMSGHGYGLEQRLWDVGDIVKLVEEWGDTGCELGFFLPPRLLLPLQHWQRPRQQNLRRRSRSHALRGKFLSPQR